MKGGPGKNKQGDPKQHMQMGGMVRPSGFGGAQITPQISPRNLAAQPRLVGTPRLPMGNRRMPGAFGYKKGGLVKKRKGYKHGGMVSKAYKEARKKEPTGRLTARDISGGMVSGAYKRARKKEPTGRLTDRDVRRAGLK